MAYLDYNSTTPVDPCVLDTMAPMFSGKFGNPSSMHRTGRKAADLVYEVRDQVAEAGFGWRRIQCCQKNNGSRTGHKEMNRAELLQGIVFRHGVEPIKEFE